MLILAVLMLGIMALIRYYFVEKHACYIAKVNYHLEVEEYDELLKKLKSLSPDQLEKLIDKCENHFSLNKKNVEL